MQGVTRPRVAPLPDLDVFRGWAAVLMVLNHAGFQLLAPADAADGPMGSAVFLGSFAPVLFFFATGFGVGLSSARKTSAPRSRAWWGPLWKATLLLLADRAAFWAHGVAFGLDFFGFIALSLLVATFVSRRAHAERWAWALVAALLMLRFVAGPLAKHELPATGFVAWIAGVQGQDGVSYPLAPWLTYPLVGLVLGRRFVSVGSGPHLLGKSTAWAVGGGVVAVLALAVTSVMVGRGAGLFRWGSMSAAYYAASWAVLGLFASVAIGLVASSPRVARWIALAGVASFAIVPLHFLLLAVLAAAIALPVTPAGFAAAVAAVIAFAWMAAKGFSDGIESDHVVRRRRAMLLSLMVACAAAFGVLVLAPSIAWAGLLALFVLQMAVAGMLGLRVASR